MLNHKALAASASAPKVYIEDVFSTWLYDGNGSTQTITNGIDLSGKGGLVWVKSRSTSEWNVFAHDSSESYSPQYNGGNVGQAFTAFNPNGFSLSSGGSGFSNSNGAIYTSWTFRKAPKFFDVVTYTGDGVAGRTVAHNLGSAPGTIIVKRTDSAGSWPVYHRSLGSGTGNGFLMLNTTAAANAAGSAVWGDGAGYVAPTSTSFTVQNDLNVNANGGTYVAYLFAHDTSADGLIQCGTFTTDGAGAATVNLGWEPQWVLYKSSSAVTQWFVLDTMRGWVEGANDSYLFPNLADAENSGDVGAVNATGFSLKNASASATYVYIAIRRGPMKTPTDATKVFQPNVYTGTLVDNRLVNTGIVTDMVWARQRNDTVLSGMVVGDRMRGQPYLLTGGTAGEVSDADSLDQQILSAVEYGTAFSSMTGFWVGASTVAKLNANSGSSNHVALAFRRAPGFFDVVAYTGTGSARTVSHNLGMAPELMIVKKRNAAQNWMVYAAAQGASKAAYLDLTNAFFADSGNAWNNTSPTSTVFTVNAYSSVNNINDTFIAYLFATLTGVSKVGSYTGTGTTLDIDCGFTAGGRFVLIKRTDSTGNWYIWDSARGIVSGNDPYLLLNSTAAEVTNTDYIDPLSSGFQISSTAPAEINASGGSYIFLAVA